MNTIELMILGIVQGLTEFLPISSSGHLVIFKQILAADHLAFGEPIIEVALHVGTLVAILLYYRKDACSALGFLLRRKPGQQTTQETGRLLLWIVIGSVPTFFLGYFFKDWFEACFEMPVLVGGALCVTGGLCILSRFVPKGTLSAERLGWRRSLCVGVAQGLAIMPGISRSGSTIVTGLCLGVKPEQAGRFSFLLSVPAVA
ncbi:MAG: undecaprenyl-diphosphate phosphatase, partial [Planctomycetes bacterium]|nr:undecaprenyl-diphosphate phosphatase [Planctomycetota bacterium]